MAEDKKVYTREESLEMFAKEYEEIKKRHTQNYEEMNKFKEANKDFWDIKQDEEKSQSPEFEEANTEYKKLMSELKEIKGRRRYLERQITDLASDTFQDMTEEILNLQDDIEKDKENIATAESLIADIQKDLIEFTDDEDHCTKLKESLESALEVKQKFLDELKKKEETLKQLNVSVDDLLKKYGRIISKQTKRKDEPKKEEKANENKDESKIDNNEKKNEEVNEEAKESKEDKPKKRTSPASGTYVNTVLTTEPETKLDNTSQDNSIENEKPKDTLGTDTKKLKREVGYLAYKAKNGKLSQEETQRIAELMGDPSKYKEIGITTGIFRNNAKSFLKVLADDAVAESAETIRKIQKAIPDSDIKYEVKNGQDMVSLGALKSWGVGIKRLTTDEEISIDAEEYFKNILDAKALDKVTDKVEKDGKEVDLKDLLYADVQKCLNQYAILKKASTGYRTAVQERKQSGLFGRFGKTSSVKPLPSSQEANSPVPTNPTSISGINGQVKNDAEYTVIPPSSPSKGPQSRDII